MSKHPYRDTILVGCFGLTAFAAASLLPIGSVHAQSAAEQLLKQVLPGATEDSGDLEAAGERACERYAENDGLEVRRVLETRPARGNNLEVTLSVEDRGERYEAVCSYDGDEREVRSVEPVGTGSLASGEVDEQLARRARDACWEAAKRRDLEEVDFDEVEEKGRDTVEVTMRAEDRGERLDVTCLYDDDDRQAFLAE